MNLIDFNNGTITVTTTGGTAPYSFLLQQNGSTFNYGGSNFVNPISSSSGTVVFGNAADTTGQFGLPAGDYTCQITDSNGCIINTPTLTVQQNGNLPLGSQSKFFIFYFYLIFGKFIPLFLLNFILPKEKYYFF